MKCIFISDDLPLCFPLQPQPLVTSDLGVEVPPIIQQPLTSLTVQAGETATLTCRLCGKPRPLVTWHYNDTQITGHSQKVKVMYSEDGMATLQVCSS